MSHLDVLVVGGGISGLAIAHNLASSGLRVEVWEGTERVGGKIQTVVKQGYQMEKAASMVMNFRSEMDQFLRHAGLETHKHRRSPTVTRYLAEANRLVEVPTGIRQLLTTPLFSTAGKLRLLAEPLAPRSDNPDESIAAFITRRLGKEFLDKVFEPYVAGPLASDVNVAEARATMPRLTALEKSYRSLALGAIVRKLSHRGSAARPEVFSFTGGMGTLAQKLADEGRFQVRNNMQVSELWPVKDGWMTRAATADGARTVFSRQLVLSTPAPAAAALVEQLDLELARQLRGIHYTPISIVHTGFRRSQIKHRLNGSGFLVPRQSGFTPNGCLWMSSLFADHAPEDKVLMSTYLGGARNPAAAGWDTQRSHDVVMQMLSTLMGIKSDPDLLHVVRHSSGLPIYHGAYSRRLAAIGDRLGRFPGLHLEANYKGGVSVRDRILCAEKIACRILRQLDSELPSHDSGPVLKPVQLTAAIR